MEKTGDSWEIYKKNKGRRQRETEKEIVERWAQRQEKSPELPSEEIQAWSLLGDNIEQNMYWRQRLCLLPVPFQ